MHGRDAKNFLQIKGTMTWHDLKKLMISICGAHTHGRYSATSTACVSECTCIRDKVYVLPSESFKLSYSINPFLGHSTVSHSDAFEAGAECTIQRESKRLQPEENLTSCIRG